MNIKEVLKLTDDLVFAKTGKHLNDLQETILQGTWNDEDYETIAQLAHRSEDRVREVGMELWQTLSQQLGEKVSKSNFRSVIKRAKNSNILNFEQKVIVKDQGSFNICGESLHHPNTSNYKPNNNNISNLK